VSGSTPDEARERLPARDIVDVRLSAALAGTGCPLCAIRARSESAALDSIIAELVLDIPFRADLERSKGFCRRHVRELVEADRRERGSLLGSSILYGAILGRRLEIMRGAVEARGRGRRTRLSVARKRPPCLACAQGVSGVETAMARLVERCSDPAWSTVVAVAPFCVDDLLALWTVAGDSPAFDAVARRQVERLDELQRRLEGFVDHSSHDRRHLLTDQEASATRDAADALGGTRADRPGPSGP